MNSAFKLFNYVCELYAIDHLKKQGFTAEEFFAHKQTLTQHTNNYYKIVIIACALDLALTWEMETCVKLLFIIIVIRKF